MTRSIWWRRIWIKMLLFFLRTSMKEFCFSLSLRNAMNSTLQNRDIRDNQWNASLFLCRRTSFQSVLTASVYLLHFTLRRLQLNRFRPARRLPPGRLTPHSVKQLHSLSTALRVLFFPPISFSNISLNAAAANSPSERTCSSEAVRALSDWRRLQRSRARPVVWRRIIISEFAKFFGSLTCCVFNLIYFFRRLKGDQETERLLTWKKKKRKIKKTRCDLTDWAHRSRCVSNLISVSARRLSSRTALYSC